MFKRTLQVRLIKTKKEESLPTLQEKDGFDTKIKSLIKAFEPVFKKAAKAMVLYIVLDTARQVAVTKAQQ